MYVLYSFGASSGLCLLCMSCTHVCMYVMIICKTLIGVHEMHNHYIFCWPMTPSHHWPTTPMITHTPLVAGNLCMHLIYVVLAQLQGQLQCSQLPIRYYIIDYFLLNCAIREILSLPSLVPRPLPAFSTFMRKAGCDGM